MGSSSTRSINKLLQGVLVGAQQVVEFAVVKSLEHYDDFIKLRETLQSLYQEYHYSAKALRELRNLAEALEEKVSRPLNVLGARGLPHLQTALKIVFDGYKVLVMHSENTKEGRVGSAGRQGRATISAKFLTSLKGLLFAHLTWTSWRRQHT